MKSFIQFVNESILNPNDPHGDYKAKKKALQDLQMDKNTHKDSDLSKSIVQRHSDLDKEYAKYKVQEDGGAGGMGGGMTTGGSSGPTNTTGVKSSTDPISATAVRPKTKKKYLMGIRRNPPKM